jgi:hypothetical protein
MPWPTSTYERLCSTLKSSSNFEYKIGFGLVYRIYLGKDGGAAWLPPTTSIT